jgi:signal transduction histidine kinase
MVRWPTRGDWAVAVAVTVLSVLAPRAGGPSAVPAWAAALAPPLALAEGVPTAWRRVRPVVVAAVTVPASLLYGVLVAPAPPYAGWVVLFAVVVHTETRDRAVMIGTAVAAALAVGIALAAWVHEEGRNELVPLLILTLTVLLAAALTRAERGRLAALRDRAALLEREQEAVRGEAALAERLRVARELHDVVGHGLSAIAVQSSTGRVALDAGDLRAVRTALVNTEATSRTALREMRELLGVLRSPTATGAPGVAELSDLVAGAVGIRATLTSTGDLAHVPVAVGRCAYRVVQESLTNAAKHAPDATVHVRLVVTDGELVVEVDDDGADRRSALDTGAGQGLLGMRERVEALHGTLEAGPISPRGWRVQARLPLGEVPDR